MYGDRYLTSNVQIKNKDTGKFEDIGHKFRYFTTKKGLRIMSFGVLFDFTGNSNVSKITKTDDMVKETWFKDAVNYPEPIDLFVVIGHNPVRTSESTSTFGKLHSTIRQMRPDVPIQAFGGHTHIRDFVVYDEISTGLESGRYCETLGWLSLTGIQSDNFKGTTQPKGVPNPTRKAIAKDTSKQVSSRDVKKADLRYSRRYLDWNRLTFSYHAKGSQDHTFDTKKGLEVTDKITDSRKQLNLQQNYGCVPQTYCMNCKPFASDGNIYQLVQDMFAKIIVNETRSDKPRLIIANTGSVRFDLVQGPLTENDAYNLFPFQNFFQFIPDVPYSQASQVLDILNAGPYQKRSLRAVTRSMLIEGDVCANPSYEPSFEGEHSGLRSRSMERRDLEDSVTTPGYVTVDDFGDDGDDTPHSKIDHVEQPNDVQGNASFPTNGKDPEAVDLVFIDFIAKKYVIPALAKTGASYTADNIQDYMPKDFTMTDLLTSYAKKYWQKGMPNCPVGEGVG